MAQASTTTSTKQRYCIVTGANAGIGKEITAGLMQQGGHVVMACRNLEACAEARAELERRNLPGSCECCRLDLADTASIRAFAAEQASRLQQQKKQLDVLVNNAGVLGDRNTSSTSSSSDAAAAPASSSSSSPKLHNTLVINHLRPFLLTGLLLPTMAAGSRVVNVSSRAHFACKSFQVADNSIVAGPGAGGGWFSNYAASKLCNVLHVRELQDRYQQSRGIIATSVSPGFVATNIFRSLPGTWAWLADRVAPWLGKTPAQGAAVAVFAAISPSLCADTRVPLLFHDNKPMQPSALAQDKQLAADLWAASCAAVGWSDDDS